MINLIRNLSKYTLWVVAGVLLLGGIFNLTIPIQAQRKRPSGIRHSEAEIIDVLREKKIKLASVKSGARYNGQLYYSSEGKRMQIGTVRLFFHATTYEIKVEFKSEQMRTLLKDHFGNVIGSKATNMGDDISCKGRYACLEQSNKRFVRLYDGDGDTIFTDLYTLNVSGSILDLTVNDILTARLDCLN